MSQVAERLDDSSSVFGPGLVRSVLRSDVFGEGRAHRLVPTRANAQPAFGVYVDDSLANVADANDIWLPVLSVERRTSLVGLCCQSPAGAGKLPAAAPGQGDPCLPGGV